MGYALKNNQHLQMVFCRQTLVRYPLSVIRYPLSVIRYPLSVIRYPLSVIRYPVLFFIIFHSLLPFIIVLVCFQVFSIALLSL
ncbi:TPA: hypothetical protein R6264_002485 [Legionella pneumophila]|nr:hypothetical protein [Legionella pneumophila]